MAKKIYVKKPKNILLLDDDSRDILNLKIFLEDEGFNCHVAENAELAFSILRKQPIDVAVVDIVMPGISGETFIDMAAQNHKGLKFLVHTGIDDFQIPDKLKKHSVTEDEILNKPVSDMNAIINKINCLIK